MPTSTKLRVWFGISWKLALFVVILLAAKAGGDLVMDRISQNLTPSTEPTLHKFIMVAIGIYVCLMMLPFVPGAEIGLGLMTMLGPSIAPLVYFATVLALSLAFMIGRLVPQDVIIRGFELLRLKRAARLLSSLRGLEQEERLSLLLGNTSSRYLPYLLRYRLVAVMIALNIPGNAVIGGGGGICMVAGFSRLFPFHAFLIGVAIAVAPVPLFLFITN